MIRHLRNIYRLGVKELYSLRHDKVLTILILYAFSFAIYSVAKGVNMEVRNAAVAIVDEDGSELSQHIRDSFIPPYFKKAELISVADIDRVMDSGRYSFVIDIPPRFQSDVLAGRQPSLQVNVDATAMTLAGNGANYIQSIINRELLVFTNRNEADVTLPVELTIRASFNPNLDSSWFTSVMQLINSVTILAIILSGAAIIREREHGTLEHLLVMPLTASEIMVAKVWANAFVIVGAATLSLLLVVSAVIGLPVSAGSAVLFAFGAALYLFSVTSLGIMLATIATTMPQFGLLAIPVMITMSMLSGGISPLESMPMTLQIIMNTVPSTHFTSFAQAVLYRGAGLSIVWPQMLAIVAIGIVYFLAALARFRRTISAAR